MKIKIQTIVVIGAESRGREIALACVRAGYATILEDVSRSRLENAVVWLEKSLRALPNPPVGAQHCCAPVGTIAPPQQLERPANWLRTSSVLEDAVRDADLILESAADELEVKLELFTLFDKFAKPGAILASTSASVSIADMASVTFCAERCIGMRFPEILSSRPSGCALAQPEAEGPAFSAHANVIELVVTQETSAETVAACREVASRMGKAAVVVQETASALGRSAKG